MVRAALVGCRGEIFCDLNPQSTIEYYSRMMTRLPASAIMRHSSCIPQYKCQPGAKAGFQLQSSNKSARGLTFPVDLLDSSKFNRFHRLSTVQVTPYEPDQPHHDERDYQQVQFWNLTPPPLISFLISSNVKSCNRKETAKTSLSSMFAFQIPARLKKALFLVGELRCSPYVYFTQSVFDHLQAHIITILQPFLLINHIFYELMNPNTWIAIRMLQWLWIDRLYNSIHPWRSLLEIACVEVTYNHHGNVSQ